MLDLFGGMLGGVGLFFVGMWLLTENLKALASRRLRLIARRWTERRMAAFGIGALAGVTTQSMAALTFIVVSMAKSRLVSTRGAFAIVLGGNVGVSLLVFMLTFDIRLVALYVVGATGLVLASDRVAGDYRRIAASVFGVGMIFLGLGMLVQAAAPLGVHAWFSGMMEWTVGSLLLAFLVAALLTVIVQSGAAVCVLGISMATLGVLTVDQTIMLLYGVSFGSALIQYLLSVNLTGRSRQVAMFQVGLNVLISAVAVPALFVELELGVPLMKALALSLHQELAQQMALLLLFANLFGALAMLAVVGPVERVFARLWPPTPTEELEKTEFLHDGALEDVVSALLLVELEQRRVFANLPRYFETVRSGAELAPLRRGIRSLLAEIERFQTDLLARHAVPARDEHGSMLTRQKLLVWLEEQVAVLCEALGELPERSDLGALRTSLCEGTDAVFQSLIHAMRSRDREAWALARDLAGDRSELMRAMRRKYGATAAGLDGPSRSRVIGVTTTVEHVFFLLSKLVQEMDVSALTETASAERAARRVEAPAAGARGTPSPSALRPAVR